MQNINRRDFLISSAALAAGSVAAPAGARLNDAKMGKAARICKLGKTGLKSSMLGMGTGTKAWNFDSAQIRSGKDNFVRTLIHAYERGITYFDLADMYGSHAYMRRAMAEGNIPREKVMILTKTISREPEKVKADLDRFLQEAGTDYLDIVLLHCLTEGGWETKLQGCMDVLSEAKSKGIIRAHGCSCHNLDAMKDAAKSPWVDIMLSRINPWQIKMDGTVEEVVAVLQTGHKNGKGMLGMKIAGEGEAVDRLPESLKFVMNLGCIDAFNIGFLSPQEVDDTIAKMEAV